MNRISPALVATAFSLSALGCATPAPVVAPPAGRAVEQQPLASGDAIRIRNWREPQMDGEYQVDEAGSVVLPLLGRVSVTARDPVTLKTELLEGYGRELRDADLEITLLRRIAILGGIRSPGLYLLDPTMRLADAVALAQGASQTGDIENTRVLRDGEDISGSVDPALPLLVQLEPGDQIYVPDRSWFQRNSIVLIASFISGAAIIYAATIR